MPRYIYPTHGALLAASILVLSLLSLLPQVIALPSAGATTARSFQLQVSAAGQSFNNKYVTIFQDEAEQYTFSFFYPDWRGTFTIANNTGRLNSQVPADPPDEALTLYAAGRSNYKPDLGHAQMESREAFKRDAWQCKIAPRTQTLECTSRFGSNWFVCTQFEWIYLRDTPPSRNDCSAVKFLVR